MSAHKGLLGSFPPGNWALLKRNFPIKINKFAPAARSSLPHNDDRRRLQDDYYFSSSPLVFSLLVALIIPKKRTWVHMGIGSSLMLLRTAAAERQWKPSRRLSNIILRSPSNKTQILLVCLPLRLHLLVIPK